MRLTPEYCLLLSRTGSAHFTCLYRNPQYPATFYLSNIVIPYSVERNHMVGETGFEPVSKEFQLLDTPFRSNEALPLSYSPICVVCPTVNRLFRFANHHENTNSKYLILYKGMPLPIIHYPDMEVHGDRYSLMVEQYMGFEPIPSVWKTDVLTIEH